MTLNEVLKEKSPEFLAQLETSGVDLKNLKVEIFDYDNLKKLKKFCNKVHDYRRNNWGNFRYPLEDILFIAILAIICVCKNVKEIHTFAVAYFQKLKGFLTIEEIPSYVTFLRILSDIEINDLQKCLNAWIKFIGVEDLLENNIYIVGSNFSPEELRTYLSVRINIIDFVYNCNNISNIQDCDEQTSIVNTSIRHFAVDGKAIRKSYCKSQGINCPIVVTLYDPETYICVDSVVVDKKSNEIRANTKIGERNDLKGAFITFDALGTQKSFLGLIHNSGGYYVAQVKNNQKELKNLVNIRLDMYAPNPYLIISEKNRDRFETREYYLTMIPYTLEKEGWVGVKAFGKIVTTVERDGKSSKEVHLYVMNFYDANLFPILTRAHWGIENKLHNSLDTTFKEDNSRSWIGNTPIVLNLLRKLSITFLNFAKRLIVDFKRSISHIGEMIKADFNILEEICKGENFSLNNILGYKKLTCTG